MRAVLPAQEVIGFCSFLVNCVCWYMGVDVRCFFVCACGRKGESPIRQKVQQRESCIVGCNGMQSVEEMAIKNGPGWRSVAKGALSANAVYIKIYVKQVGRLFGAGISLTINIEEDGSPKRSDERENV